jgi:hypothetical protein
MKCIKNAKSGQIIRVSDTQANNTVGREWSFVSKSEWKAATRKPVVVEAQEETIAQKQLKRKKKQ